MRRTTSLSISTPKARVTCCAILGQPPTRIPSFHFHNDVDEFFGGALRTRMAVALRRKQQAIFSLGQRLVQMQQRGRLQSNSRTEKAGSTDEECAQTGDHPVQRAQIRRPFTAAVQDEQLMPEQYGLCQHATEPARVSQPNNGDDQMHQKDQEVAHFGNPTKIRKPFSLALL